MFSVDKLFDIVDDILNCDCNLIVEFVEDSKKNKDTHNLDKNLDLIWGDYYGKRKKEGKEESNI